MINFKKKIIIKKNFLLLRIISSRDINKNYLHWMNDYDTIKFTEQRFNKNTKTSIKKYVNEKLFSNFDFLFGIFYKNAHIGNIKIGPINYYHKTAEVSYFIGEKFFLRKGLASQALGLIVHFAFKKIGLKKIVAYCYENNLGSQKVLKKNRFKLEGEMKSQILFNRKRISKLLFGLYEK
jgi:hypothetical protein